MDFFSSANLDGKKRKLDEHIKIIKPFYAAILLLSTWYFQIKQWIALKSNIKLELFCNSLVGDKNIIPELFLSLPNHHEFQALM